MIDRIYIGRIPTTGTLALTGLGLCFPIIMIVTAFANLFSFGGAPLFSMERGRENDEEAQKIMGNSFLMTLVLGVMLLGTGLLVKESLLYALGASSATFHYANDYISIYLLGTVFVMISLSMNGFINCQGFAKMGMLTVLIGAVLNLLLDPIFIFGFHMGVKGCLLYTSFCKFNGFFNRNTAFCFLFST